MVAFPVPRSRLVRYASETAGRLVNGILGRYERVEEHALKALRLSPLDPRRRSTSMPRSPTTMMMLSSVPQSHMTAPRSGPAWVAEYQQMVPPRGHGVHRLTPGPPPARPCGGLVGSDFLPRRPISITLAR